MTAEGEKMADERKTSGEYYPGGRAGADAGQYEGQGGDEVPKVPVTRVEQLPENYRESDMRSKINQLCRIVSGGVAALAAMVAAGAEIAVQGARKDALWNSDFVVTNVTADLGGLIERSEFAHGTNAVAQSARSEIAAATNDVLEAAAGAIAAATNDLAGAVCEGIASATNSMDAATDAKLAGYATRAWVQGQGYSNGSNMTAYAEKSWVVEQGYADRSWVESRGFMMATNLVGYATKDWVQGRGYLTQHQSLEDYATKGWVTGMVGEMDGRTAYRLMEPGADEWIDGTGAVWRTTLGFTWKGETVAEPVVEGIWSLWETNAWWGGYYAHTAATGMWYAVEYLDPAQRIAVGYYGYGLPGGEGSYALEAEHVALDGVPVTPGLVTSNGWYQISDGTNAWYVSPLVTTVTVAKVTNSVDRLARIGDVRQAELAIQDGIAALPQMTTNDVCAIVTNEVEEGFTEWQVFTNGVLMQGAYVQVYPVEDPGDDRYWFDVMFESRCFYERAVTPAEIFTNLVSVSGVFQDFLQGEEYMYLDGLPFVAKRERIGGNALGLARISDLTNRVTHAELEAAIEDIDLPDTSRLATKQELAAVSNESAIVTRLYMASNVIDEVTNYNSVVRLPSRRMYQLTESNDYVMVWNELDQHTNTLAKAKKHADDATNELARTLAPRAWSKTTSGLGADAPANTTWISTPTTVIAGGLEYSKVIHSYGQAWVLSGNGMIEFNQNTNAYLRIAADDGTEIFSIEKTDAVTVGADADGITVSGNVVTIPVGVVSSDHPTMYWRQTLDSGAWSAETENGLPFTAVWSGSTGAWVMTVTFSSDALSLSFFRFTYEQPGSTVIKNSAATDVSGGLVINGVPYRNVGTATINGHTVITVGN